MNLQHLLPIGRAFSPAEERPGKYRAGAPAWWKGLGPEGGSAVDRTVKPLGDAESLTHVRRGLKPSAVAQVERGDPLRSRHRRLPVWLEQLLLLLFRPGNRRRGSRPVQTEMCFDAVKVARNDLTTADVEVVVVPSGSGRQNLSPECRGRLVRLWWRQGARRLRQLGNTLF